ncbi:unnamed protein product [Victoria cruziana]
MNSSSECTSLWGTDGR